MVNRETIIVLAMCLSTSPAFAVEVSPTSPQNAATETAAEPPLPEPRPDNPADSDAPEGNADAEGETKPTERGTSDESDTPPQPPLPEKPPVGGADAGDDVDDDADGSDISDDADAPAAELAPPSETVPEGMSDEQISSCERDLRELGVKFEVLEPIAAKGECGVARPYNVTEIDGVTVRPGTRITCDAALGLARWMRGVVQPSAAAMGPEIRVSGITHASTYICRRRNNQADGKLSEHARGQAIDIATFAFDGREPLAIAPRAGRGTMAEAFQNTVQAGACLYFTTVLGPGSDEYHNDHLHLDVIERASGYRLCQ